MYTCCCFCILNIQCSKQRHEEDPVSDIMSVNYMSNSIRLIPVKAGFQMGIDGNRRMLTFAYWLLLRFKLHHSAAEFAKLIGHFL